MAAGDDRTVAAGRARGRRRRLAAWIWAIAPAACDRPVDIVAELPAPGAPAAAACAPAPATPAPGTPEVLIALDRSGSTSRPLSTGGPSRLEVMVTALRDLVRRYEGRVRWGYLEFPMNTYERACPGGLACCAGGALVAPSPFGFQAIDQVLQTSSRCTPGASGGCGEVRVGTPTWDALRVARELYAAPGDGRARYVLLATDGEPGCSSFPNACNASEEEARRLLAAGVRTIVLGVGQDAAASACLGRLALAGGAPRPGGPPHHHAGIEPESLRAYFDHGVLGPAAACPRGDPQR
jgi:hypothetical protein